jgi:hypothetical protein
VKHTVFGYLESNEAQSFQATIVDLRAFINTDADQTVQVFCYHENYEREAGCVRDQIVVVEHGDLVPVIIVPEDADMPIERIEEALEAAINAALGQ